MVPDWKPLKNQPKEHHYTLWIISIVEEGVKYAELKHCFEKRLSKSQEVQAKLQKITFISSQRPWLDLYLSTQHCIISTYKGQLLYRPSSSCPHSFQQWRGTTASTQYTTHHHQHNISAHLPTIVSQYFLCFSGSGDLFELNSENWTATQLICYRKLGERTYEAYKEGHFKARELSLKLWAAHDSWSIFKRQRLTARTTLQPEHINTLVGADITNV